MFGIGFGEGLVIAVLALFIFGPERLPKLAADAGRMLRELRRMAQGARQEIGDTFGSDFEGLSLEDLNPKTFVRKNLLEGEDDVNVKPRSRPTSQRPGEPAPWDPDIT